MRTSIFILFLFSLSLGQTGFSKEEPLPTVKKVDLNKYIGTWYEIASLPAWFSKKCESDIIARYTWKEDKKSIEVNNSCRKRDGELSESIGRSFIADETSFSKLKITFVPFCLDSGCFAGDYWILDLGSKYEYALVGEPKRDYLWILSRTKKMPEKTYQALVKKAKNLGFDVEKLEIKPQS